MFMKIIASIVFKLFILRIIQKPLSLSLSLSLRHTHTQTGGKMQRFETLKHVVLSTDHKMIPVRNVIDALAQDFVLNNESLLPILKA